MWHKKHALGEKRANLLVAKIDKTIQLDFASAVHKQIFPGLFNRRKKVIKQDDEGILTVRVRRRGITCTASCDNLD